MPSGGVRKKGGGKTRAKRQNSLWFVSGPEDNHTATLNGGKKRGRKLFQKKKRGIHPNRPANEERKRRFQLILALFEKGGGKKKGVKVWGEAGENLSLCYGPIGGKGFFLISGRGRGGGVLKTFESTRGEGKKDKLPAEEKRKRESPQKKKKGRYLYFRPARKKKKRWFSSGPFR